MFQKQMFTDSSELEQELHQCLHASIQGKGQEVRGPCAGNHRGLPQPTPKSKEKQQRQREQRAHGGQEAKGLHRQLRWKQRRRRLWWARGAVQEACGEDAGHQAGGIRLWCREHGPWRPLYGRWSGWSWGAGLGRRAVQHSETRGFWQGSAEVGAGQSQGRQRPPF